MYIIGVDNNMFIIFLLLIFTYYFINFPENFETEMDNIQLEELRNLQRERFNEKFDN